jgi:hypothetical protein
VLGHGRRRRNLTLCGLVAVLALGAGVETTSALPAGPPTGCGAAVPVVGPEGQALGCTHGPDIAPFGVNPQTREPQVMAAAVNSAAVPCYGDGQSGNRVQAVYAFAAGTPDRYAQVVDAIRGYAAMADNVFANSAAKTGGVRHVRWVTDASCRLVVLKVQVPNTGADTFANTIVGLKAAGLSRNDRKYLTWVDARQLCGIGQIVPDDRATSSNLNNGGQPLYARVDTGCWGVSGQTVEAHELMHMLGGVQTTAPHATAQFHCTDDYDRMCYADSTAVTMQYRCPASAENLFDCNSDDYFSTAPAAGGYLATHWNTASSSFLSSISPTYPKATAGGGYVLDGYGGLHPIALPGGVPPPAATGPSWPGWDIARGVALASTRTGGYVLDGYGGIHPFAVAGNAPPPNATGGPAWPGWDIASGIASLANGTGYVLDGYGGIHPFAVAGNAPPPNATGGPTWPGWDIARDIALLPNGTGGYVLDGYGGIHPFAVGTNAAPPPAAGGPYWQGWDIARGITLLPNGTGGYVLDGYGGIHPFAVGTNARPGSPSGAPSWSGWDIANGISV